MSLTVITLEAKQPWEKVPYTLDFSKLTPFSSGAEVISGAAFDIFGINDTYFTSPISAMVGPISFSDLTATCRVGSGNDAVGVYILRCRVTCALSGDQYEQECHFNVLQTI